MNTLERKLTINTIKPVVRFVGGWGSDIHSLNTQGADFYHFTLDYYNDKPSFGGGFAWGLDGCYSYDDQPFDHYAINLNTGDVIDLDTKDILFNLTEVKA